MRQDQYCPVIFETAPCDTPESVWHLISGNKAKTLNLEQNVYALSREKLVTFRISVKFRAGEHFLELFKAELARGARPQGMNETCHPVLACETAKKGKNWRKLKKKLLHVEFCTRVESGKNFLIAQSDSVFFQLALSWCENLKLRQLRKSMHQLKIFR